MTHTPIASQVPVVAQATNEPRTNEPQAFLASLSSEPASRFQLVVATAICVIATVVTIGLLPVAAHAGPAIPAFILINQTALFVAYALGAWVLFRQFRRSGSVSVCLLGRRRAVHDGDHPASVVEFSGASKPTAALWATDRRRRLGYGRFWHLGPPTCALAYGLTVRGGRPVSVSKGSETTAALLASVIALVAAGLSALIATAGLPWLPHQVTGDDYSALTTSGRRSGGAGADGRRTDRGCGAPRRGAARYWSSGSPFRLVLLILDNFLTMAGGARATIGWYVGRIEALVSAFAILWA